MLHNLSLKDRICSGPAKRNFGPILRKAQIPHLPTLLATHPFPARGVHKASKTGSNEPQRLFARFRNNLFGGYTSHDFVTAGARCGITTALQPSTSINRGLTAVPKVKSISSSKPPLSDLYWLERRSACRYTPHVVPGSILDARDFYCSNT